ncbi:MAG TPA: RlmE family RNA methyltransferase [Deltaproteobacteria bacterium]|nr:MAG: hypothetical protein A3I09_03185 [Deltaproteobacteria bacterium RIFCSPLOWO2_02_FULL_47_10]HBF13203.1 RlmE family RNA methyltransferase [Deltaproteobacteria bacterium]
MYNRKDYYYKKAKEEGKASRASYKLEQIQAKYRIIKKGDNVVDLGCAPGSWLEAVSDMVGSQGFVAGIDLLPIKVQLKPNMKFVQGDICDERIVGKIIPQGGFNIVLSDMAPNTSGLAFKDSYLSYELGVTALEFAKVALKKGGNFVTKIFQGSEVAEFRRELKKYFKRVETYVPPATRQTSKELYLVAVDFQGISA